MPKNIFYAQSGGPTAVINASACGLIETARQHSDQIGKVFAGKNGILGALNEELIDTSLESNTAIAALKHTPASAFGSCRYKLKSIDQDRAQYERLIEVFKAHDIGFFFYNGGGDSQDTAYKVSQIGRQLGYPLTCIGVPKTIDNDLPITDCCPGFGSVAKYIAVSTQEAALDVKGMAATSTKIFILEVMGRHTGWIAAAAGLAKKHPGSAPHIILFPEIAFDQERFLAETQRCVEQYGYCVIVASEGVRYANGDFVASSSSTDAFGHKQLGGAAPCLADMIQKRHGYKYHWAVSDYLQRAARHLASQTDVDQAYAMGKHAIDMALKGKNNIMITIDRISQSPYQWQAGHAPLSEVANVEKDMPRNFISDNGFEITPLCHDYLSPLIQGESYPPYQNGLPAYVQLKNQCITKKLNTTYVS